MMNEAFACVEVRFQQLMQNVTEEDLAEIQHALNVLQSKLFNRQK